MVTYSEYPQTSRRLGAISRLRTIWHHAYVFHILCYGLPLSIPHLHIPSVSSAELERVIRRAIQTKRFWSSKDVMPQQAVSFRANVATKLTDVRFLPARDGRYIITASKGIWSALTCWDVGPALDAKEMNSLSDRVIKVAEWGPKGAIFSEFVVNKDPSSDGVLAISVNTGEYVLLSLCLNVWNSLIIFQDKNL